MVILVRFGEIALKSRFVRKMFQDKLINNIQDVFLKEDAECAISSDFGRIYLESNDLEASKSILKRIFGIVSFSPSLQCSADLEDISKVAVSLSNKLLRKGTSFAIRARRTGEHSFTSQDIAREVGSAVLNANKDSHVDLEEPDLEIFIEVRGNKAFVFHEKINGPSGMPLGTQGKVLARVDSKEGMVSAWLMMKRGCKVNIASPNSRKWIEPLKLWDIDLKVNKVKDVKGMEKLSEEIGAEALVFGWRLEEFSHRGTDIGLPAFYPVIGMDDKKIEELSEKILEAKETKRNRRRKS